MYQSIYSQETQNYDFKLGKYVLYVKIFVIDRLSTLLRCILVCIVVVFLETVSWTWNHYLKAVFYKCTKLYAYIALEILKKIS